MTSDTDLTTQLAKLIRRWRAEMIGTADVQGGYNDGRALALADCADDLERATTPKTPAPAADPIPEEWFT